MPFSMEGMGIYGICLLYILPYAGYVNLPHLPLDSLKAPGASLSPGSSRFRRAKTWSIHRGPAEKPEVALVSPMFFLTNP